MTALETYRSNVDSQDIEIYSESALTLRQTMIETDPYYPTYHFAPVESWINDPNGPIYLNGRYHLFYQFDPPVKNEEGNWENSRRWGHAVSLLAGHYQEKRAEGLPGCGS